MKQKGFAHIFLILFLLAGLAVAVYLVQQKTNILPKAADSERTTPTTSFELSPANPNDNYYKVGDLIPVNVRARSDISAANLFKAKITFDKDLLAVDSIYTANSFVKNWVENTFDNNAGTISLVGGVPTPGYKTDNTSDTGKYLLLAVINFKVLKPGSVSINLTDDSAIYSNADNINILAVKTGTVIKTGTGEGSPAPTTDIGMPPLMPMAVYGFVTVNGKLAGAGVTVSAKIADVKGKIIDSVEVASKTTDSKGRYGMSTLSDQPPADTPETTKGEYQIPADRPETTAREGGNKGDMIYFFVNGEVAQTTTFDNGKAEHLDLSIPSGSTPLSPHSVRGTVITAKGTPAGAGITVSAKIDGVEVASTTTVMYSPDPKWPTSVFSFIIPEDDPATTVKEGGVNGDIIQLYTNGVAAQTNWGSTATEIFKVGGSTGTILLIPTPTSAPNLITSVADAVTRLIGGNTPTPVPTVTSVPAPTVTSSPPDINCGRSPGTGDASNDGKVDLKDLSILLSDFGKTSGSNPATDTNGDCTINTFDVLLMRKVLIQKGVIKG